MIKLKNYTLKKKEEMTTAELGIFNFKFSVENKAPKMKEYFKLYSSLNITGREIIYSIYNNKKQLIGVFFVYGIKPDERYAYVTILIFSDHRFDVIDGTTTPIYTTIILFASMYICEHPEEVGQKLDGCIATILTLKNTGNLDTLLRYTRLRTCRKDLILAAPDYKLKEVNGNYFLFMKYSYNKTSLHKNDYLN